MSTINTDGLNKNSRAQIVRWQHFQGDFMGEIFDHLTNTETVYVPAAQFDQTVAQCQIAGWKIVSSRRDEVMLRWAGTAGSLVNHVIVGVLTLPTMGLGNLVYGTHKKGKTSKRLRVKVQPEPVCKQVAEVTTEQNSEWNSEWWQEVERLKRL